MRKIYLALLSAGLLSAGFFVSTTFVQADDAPVTEVQESSTSVNMGLYGGAVWDMAIDSEHGMLYAVANNTPNGFFYSSDNGANWIGMPAGSDFGTTSSVEVDHATGDVYVQFGSGLYRSEDHGVTLTLISEDYHSQLLYAGGRLMTTENGNTVSISSNQGESFTTVTVASGITIWKVAYSELDGKYYAMAKNGNTPLLYKSTNNGASWSLLHTFPDFSEGVHSEEIAINPINPDYMLIARGLSDGVIESTDGGSTWGDVDGITSIHATFDTAGRAYLGSHFSDNDGGLWEQLPTQDYLFGGQLFMADSTNENIVYADGAVGILRSTDRGTTWAYTNKGIAGVVVKDIKQAANKDIVWIASANGFAKSEDFTSDTPTWQFPMLNETGVAVWVDKDTPDTVLAGGICYLYRSTNGGETWSGNLVFGQVDCAKKVADIASDPNDSNIIYAAISNNDPGGSKTGAVLRSTNNGATWSDLGITNDASVQSVAVNQAGVVFAAVGAPGGMGAAQTGIYSYNGTTWTALSGAPDEEFRQIVIDPTNDNVMYALVGAENGMVEDGFGLYKTTNAGTTWSEITTDLELSSFDTFTMQDSNKLYLAGSNGNQEAVIYKSTNAGSSWGLYYTGLSGEKFYDLLFDKLTAGNDRGLYGLQSVPKITLRVNELKSATVKTTPGTAVSVGGKLTDISTGKALKKQKVKIYKKVKGKDWKLVKKVVTNKKGKFHTDVIVRKKTKYKVTWTPKQVLAEEFAAGASRVVTVKVK